MKEAKMINPNSLGHWHRDIVKIVETGRYYCKVALSCGHQTEVSRQFYNKYKDDAILCMSCTDAELAKR